MAPLQVSVMLLPEQLVVLLAEAVSEGIGLTVTCVVTVSVQPLPSVPTSVYVVVVAG